MKFRKILNFMSALIVIPISFSVVSCTYQTTSTKTDLSTVTTITGVNFDLDSSKVYTDLNDTISQANEFKDKKLTSFQVKYYSTQNTNQNLETEVSNKHLTEGTVSIVIIALNTDFNWTGQTSITNKISISISMPKTDLSTITTLSSLNLVVNPASFFNQLNSQIISADEFKDHALAPGYTIDWYSTPYSNQKLNNYNQSAGDYYVVITASDKDPYWTGSTSTSERIAISIKKADLNSLTALTNLNLIANSTQTYSQLDSQILKANEFKQNPLSFGYNVFWYASPTSDVEISTQNQTGGDAYVVIQASQSDPYWTGRTSNTNRILVNLATFTLLSGTNDSINSIAVSTTGIVYAGSDNGIVYKKNLNDTDFMAMSGTTDSIQSVAVDNSGNVFAASGAQVKIAYAGSDNFTDTATGFEGTINSITTTANVSASKPQEEILLGSDNGTVYLNYSGITTFIPIKGTTGNISYVTGSRAINTTFNCYAANSDNNVFFFKQGASGFVATTGIKGTITAMTSDATGNAYVATATGAIFKTASLNSTRFIQISSGVITEQINSITIDSNSNIWVGTINGKIYKSYENGKKFKLLTGATGSDINALNHYNSIIFAGSSDGVFQGQ